MGEKNTGGEDILFIGVGGAGRNAIGRMMRKGISGCDFMAIDTDSWRMGRQKGAKTLLIGQASLHGKGTGGYPEYGVEAAERARKGLENAIGRRKVVFLFAGMGAGTGTGATPIIAQIARKNGALVIVFATIPFKLERKRRENAKDGIRKLAKNADTVILMENDRLATLVPNLPISEAFDAMDELVAKAVAGCISAISAPTYSAFSFDDFREMFARKGFGFLAWGEGKGKEKVEVAMKGLSKNTFLDADWSKAKHAFIDVMVGRNGTLCETVAAAERARGMVSGGAAKCNTRVGAIGGDTMEITVLATGLPEPNFPDVWKANRMLFRAVKAGDLRKMALAIEKGANVNARDKLGARPLHIAAFRGNLEAAKFLVKSGADVNAGGPGGATPLSFAARMSHAKVKDADCLGLVRFLIAKDADVNAKNDMGYPPLHFAENEEVIKLLKKAGAKKFAGGRAPAE